MEAGLGRRSDRVASLGELDVGSTLGLQTSLESRG